MGQSPTSRRSGPQTLLRALLPRPCTEGAGLGPGYRVCVWGGGDKAVEKAWVEEWEWRREHLGTRVACVVSGCVPVYREVCGVCSKGTWEGFT
jgi:hypothetical protein